jgi:aspartate kinase
MLTADPRLIKDVHVVPHLSFAEASELAYFGAKGVAPRDDSAGRGAEHPGAHPELAAATGRGRHPDHPRASVSGIPLTAVASKKAVTVVDITSTRMLMAHGFLSRIFRSSTRIGRRSTS